MRDHPRGFLEDWCARLDGGPYPAYRDLRGRFELDGMTLEVLRVQPDPFAGPSRLRLLVPYAGTGLPPAIGRLDGGAGTAVPGIVDPGSARALGWRDWIGRRIRERLEREGGGSLRIEAGGQEILDRSSVLLRQSHLELRLDVDLPARGRRILGREAAHRLVRLPERLRTECLSREAIDPESVRVHLACTEDFSSLQAELERNGWLAFVADGARLARFAGNDDRPLAGADVVPFLSPPSLRQTVRLPHAGAVSGMVVEPGVTLLCGGGFHGKSTLLRALAAGVHPHRPGDGRELTATRPDAVSVRAEDGRAVSAVDLRPFLRELPLGRPVDRFRTENASGSTSQAAAILEAVQGGSRFLLFDEDTSATNFMIRDGLMARLVARDEEPITPFLERARTLSEALGVSSILVIGGSGEYFRVADRVLVLNTFRPTDRTEEARRIAAERPSAPSDAEGAALLRRAVDPDQPRLPPPAREGTRLRADGARRLRVGGDLLDLEAIESLRDPAQGRFLAAVLARWGREHSRMEAGTLGGVRTPSGLERWYLEAWRGARLDGFFESEPRGDRAAVRFADLLAAVNRLRSTGGGSE